MPRTEPSPYSESDLKKFYRESLPWLFWVLAALLLVAAITIAWIGVISGVSGAPVLNPSQITTLGSQGDFFGGHFSAILGLVTIVFIMASFLLERQRTRRAALRELFLKGVDQIISSRASAPTDAQYEGVDPVSLRLVNYYARVALANPDERELLLILNIAVTGTLRTAIEKDAKDRHDYPFASEALRKYRAAEAQMHKQKKNIN
jgi:uncharacterized membrane protein